MEGGQKEEPKEGKKVKVPPKTKDLEESPTFEESTTKGSNEVVDKKDKTEEEKESDEEMMKEIVQEAKEENEPKKKSKKSEKKKEKSKGKEKKYN